MDSGTAPASGSEGSWGADVQRIAAAVYVLGLAAAGAAVLVQNSEWATVPSVLLAFILPAAVYALGFFRFFPESAGVGPSRGRWSALLALSLVLYVPATILFMLAIEVEDRPPRWSAIAVSALLAAGAIVLSVLSCGLLQACGCGREDLPARPSLWARCMRRLACVPRLLKPRLSLLAGAALVLATLYLSTTLTGCGEPRSGYDIVAGHQAWITAEHLADNHRFAKQVLTWTGRSAYSLSVALAGLTVVMLLISLGRRAVLRGRVARVLAFVTAALALFAASDLFFGWWCATSDVPAPVFYAGLTLRAVYWLGPVVLLLAARSGEAPWPRVRAALIVLYLPVVLSDWAYTTLIAALEAYGYPVLLAGLALLWWGYAQSAAAVPKESALGKKSTAAGG